MRNGVMKRQTFAWRCYVIHCKIAWKTSDMSGRLTYFTDTVNRCILLMKSFVFWLKFHRSLFLRVHLTITQHCLDNGSAPYWRQATWASIDWACLDNSTTRRETFKFWDLVRLILDVYFNLDEGLGVGNPSVSLLLSGSSSHNANAVCTQPITAIWEVVYQVNPKKAPYFT